MTTCSLLTCARGSKWRLSIAALHLVVSLWFSALWVVGKTGIELDRVIFHLHVTFKGVFEVCVFDHVELGLKAFGLVAGTQLQPPPPPHPPPRLVAHLDGVSLRQLKLICSLCILTDTLLLLPLPPLPLISSFSSPSLPSHLYATVLLIRVHRTRQFVCNSISRKDQREDGERGRKLERGILEISANWV